MQFSKTIELKGHIIDSLTLPKVYDIILEHNGFYISEEIRIGRTKKDPSYARIKVSAEREDILRNILTLLADLGGYEKKDEEVKFKKRDKGTEMRTILMCPPTYYNIKYEINPWMNINRPADTSAAQKQWETLYDTLQNKLDLHIELIKPDTNLPDMVFTANAGLVKDRKFICSNFRYKERQPEEEHFLKWFKKNGYEVITLPKRHRFEGEGDALFSGDTIFAGYRYRSDIHSHRLIGKKLDMRVISMELTDPHFYHLDTCFCPLSDDTLFYYPGAFDSYAKKVIKNTIVNRITVRKKEASTFSCNAVVHGNRIVINKCAAILKEKLKKQGFIVYEVDLSEFIKAGGSAKCLILWI